MGKNSMYVYIYVHTHIHIYKVIKERERQCERCTASGLPFSNTEVYVYR